MPTYNFKNNVVFVTGAGRGQGRSHAVKFAENGADIVATDISHPLTTTQYPLATECDLKETARQVEATDQRVLSLRMDVREESEVTAAVDTALETFGRIDVLANNAGIWNVIGLTAMDERMWDELLETDLKGAWLCAKHIGQHFIERGGGGRIVSTASTAGLVGSRGAGHYAAAKHGVIGLTKTLALELAEHDVTVNAVAPTGVDTPMIEEILETVGESALTTISDVSGSMNVIDEQLIPPEAVSEAYLWLSSDAARYVTGTVLPVDAGMMAK